MFARSSDTSENKLRLHQEITLEVFAEVWIDSSLDSKLHHQQPSDPRQFQDSRGVSSLIGSDTVAIEHAF